MELFDKAAIISGDGMTVLPADGAYVALAEGERISYYRLTDIIENIVTMCGRFMLDQSIVDEPPQHVVAAGEKL